MIVFVVVVVAQGSEHSITIYDAILKKASDSDLNLNSLRSEYDVRGARLRGREAKLVFHWETDPYIGAVRKHQIEGPSAVLLP